MRTSSYLFVRIERAVPMTESLSSLPPRMRYVALMSLITSEIRAFMSSGRLYSDGMTEYSVCPSSVSPMVTDAAPVLYLLRTFTSEGYVSQQSV